MTLALLMFIYGMYRYWLRIYTRFALSSDRMITGKFAEIMIQFAEIVMEFAEDHDGFRRYGDKVRRDLLSHHVAPCDPAPLLPFGPLFMTTHPS